MLIICFPMLLYEEILLWRVYRNMLYVLDISVKTCMYSIFVTKKIWGFWGVQVTDLK